MYEYLTTRIKQSNFVAPEFNKHENKRNNL